MSDPEPKRSLWAILTSDGGMKAMAGMLGMLALVTERLLARGKWKKQTSDRLDDHERRIRDVESRPCCDGGRFNKRKRRLRW